MSEHYNISSERLLKRADKYIEIVKNPKSSARDVNKAIKILSEEILPQINERLGVINESINEEE